MRIPKIANKIRINNQYYHINNNNKVTMYKYVVVVVAEIIVIRRSDVDNVPPIKNSSVHLLRVRLLNIANLELF
jgi:hypothetical protein